LLWPFPVEVENSRAAFGIVYAELIAAFYRALSQPHTTKAEALQQAQLALLHNPNYRHPVHRSAYLMVGNWL